MDRTESMAEFTCRSNLIQSSVKEEPDSDCELNFEENRSNILDYRVVKAEPEDEPVSEMSDSVSDLESENFDEESGYLENEEIKKEPQHDLNSEIDSVSDLKSENLDEESGYLENKEIKKESQHDLNSESEERYSKIDDLENVKVKQESQNVCHTEICREEKKGLTVKFEADDPEVAGRGVDGGLGGRLQELEKTSPEPNGNLKVESYSDLFFFIFRLTS